MQIQPGLHFLHYNRLHQITLGWQISGSTGKLGVVVGGAYVALGTVSIVDSIWRHYGLVLTPTGYIVYINGVSTYTGSNVATITTYGSGTNLRCVMGVPNNPQWLKGRMDDFRMYTGALNQSQITTIYELGV